MRAKEEAEEKVARLKEAKQLLGKLDGTIQWELKEKGYKTSSFSSHHGGIEQRWLLVFSEQAYRREEKTLEKNLKKKEAELQKALWHLSNEIFESEHTALSALKALKKKYQLHTITGEIVPELKYEQRGRPKPGEEKKVVGYKINASFERDLTEIEQVKTRKGRFILATNDLDKENYSDIVILKEYKKQQNVEGGFRFIKDPWFMVDSIFLKSPSRIQALMMVMTLCLMVYNIAQYKLRESLKEKEDTVPNQLDKQVQNPTMRWVFQIMEGIGIIQFFKKKVLQPIEEVITNLNELRRKIIFHFGTTACTMYGLNEKNCLRV